MIWYWVPKNVVYGAHAKSLAAYGGAEGVRDEGLLESALARPENLVAYGEPEVFELAAAYAFGLVRNHPFVDGNKRTAFLTTALFLEINGYTLGASEEEATATMLAFAAGEVSEEEFAFWLKENCKPL
ncbi:MAG: death-on-curing protein [Hyphococcus sp.]|nr:MAG: death-on-curing protein [Marinicaulis sp.]